MLRTADGMELQVGAKLQAVKLGKGKESGAARRDETGIEHWECRRLYVFTSVEERVQPEQCWAFFRKPPSN